MTDESKRWHESNKDKPQCKGKTYVGCGRGGAHYEDCKRREECPKYQEWIANGRDLINYDQHVELYRCSVGIFRKCLLNKL